MSYAENGPLLSLGEVQFKVHIPGTTGWMSVGKDVYLAAKDHSIVTVSYNGLELSTLGMDDGSHRFGRSPEMALAEAAPKIRQLEGCNCNIHLTTHILYSLVMPSADDPFYAGAQRVEGIPMGWDYKAEGLKRAPEKFRILERGRKTRDYDLYIEKIMQLVDQDAAPARNGDLRSIVKNGAVELNLNLDS